MRLSAVRTVAEPYRNHNNPYPTIVNCTEDVRVNERMEMLRSVRQLGETMPCDIND